jgi:eukaryotic-like serine/threonine-protein kinase
MNPGDILDGRYEIITRLGAGGMGEVYKAKHILLGATRVIKVVHPNISTNADARERFLREARAATKVQHPNVATVHDFASLPDGSHYMVWEFIDGENLAQRLRSRGPLPPRNAVRIGIQALRGLEAIHRAGIIHRDISPENLMISHADDSVKIIDLGVAKIEEDAGAVSQTKTGIFVGKLRYASPEQLGFLPDGERVDGRADLYAMAMVIVELLTGRPPYEATSPHEYFIIHAREATLNTVVIPKEIPGSDALKDSMEKALARDRNVRYATAGAFAEALEAIEKSLPDARSTPTMAVPLDGDETMRVPPTNIDELRRSTVRTDAPNAPAAATIRTPLPMAGEPLQVAQATSVLAAPPPPPAAVPQAKSRSGISPLLLVAIISLVVLAGLLTAGVLLYPRVKQTILKFREPSTTSSPTTDVATTTSTATSTTIPTTTEATATSQASETTLTVTSASGDTLTVTLPPLTETAETTTAVIATTTRSIEPPVTRDPDSESETVAVGNYLEGGNSAQNRRAVNILRRNLRGVTEVGLVGAGGTQTALRNAMRQYLPDMEFNGEAEIRIRWNGTGRNARNGLGTVSKGDRVIFRYNSVYGSSPEGFAAVVAEAFQ